MKMRRVEYFFWILIFIVIIAKFATVAFLYSKNISPSPIQDPLEFRNLALNILNGNSFSSAQSSPYVPELYRTPGYPLFLAATFFFNRSGHLAIFFQQWMIIGLAFLIFLLIKRYRPEARMIPILAVFFLLLDPRIWFWSLETMSETLFMVFAILAFFLLLYPRSRSGIPVVGSALCFGLAVLTRPSGVLWLPGIILALALRDVDTHRFGDIVRGLVTRRRVAEFVLFGAVFASVLSPWILRNYFLVGRPIVSSAPSYNYAHAFGGEGPDNPAAWTPSMCVNEIVDSKGRAGCQIRGYTSEGFNDLQRFTNNLRRTTPISTVVWSNIKGAYLLWLPDDYKNILDIGLKIFFGSGWSVRAGAAMFVLYEAYLVVIGVFAFLGIWCIYKNRRVWSVGALPVILFVNTIFTYGLAYGRHHIPLIPSLIVLASFGVYWFQEVYTVYVRDQRI